MVVDNYEDCETSRKKSSAEIPSLPCVDALFFSCLHDDADVPFLSVFFHLRVLCF